MNFPFIYNNIPAVPPVYRGPPWSWSHNSWIYNYLCNQWLSALILWIRISIRTRCATLCDRVCQWLVTGRFLSIETIFQSCLWFLSFRDRGLLLTRKLLSQGFLVAKWKSLRKLYGYHHHLINRYEYHIWPRNSNKTDTIVSLPHL